MATICAHETNQESYFVDYFGHIKEETEEEAPKSGNPEQEVPESSNKSESETANQ
ncbi:hypothetical protein LguiB_026433 [Lonicera macranthoides]